MITVYQIRTGGYLGGTLEIDDDDGCPAGYTRTAPGDAPEGFFNVWHGTGWDLTDLPYVAPAFSTASLKERIWIRIQGERERRKAGGVLAGAKWFHSDDGSRIQWLGLKDQARDALAAGGDASTVLLESGENIMWKTRDGTFVAVTVSMAIAVVDAVRSLDAKAFKNAEVHRFAMQASDDPGSYDFSTGWPTIYGEE